MCACELFIERKQLLAFKWYKMSFASVATYPVLSRTLTLWLSIQYFHISINNIAYFTRMRNRSALQCGCSKMNVIEFARSNDFSEHLRVLNYYHFGTQLNIQLDIYGARLTWARKLSLLHTKDCSGEFSNADYMHCDCIIYTKLISAMKIIANIF